MKIRVLSISLVLGLLLLSPCHAASKNVKTKSSNVKAYVTTADRSMELSEKTMALKNGASYSAANSIVLRPATKYQTMDGFGAAVTGSTCYNLLKMTPENRAKFLEQTFSERKGYGYSYIRVAIGCSDFSMSEYTCCDKEGIANFGLTTEETDYVIPVLKEILAINPNIKIMAAPWTAPRWMKVTEPGGAVPHNSWTGGHVAARFFQDYATYFVKWIQAFRAEGIDIYAVTPQNEPLNPGNSASTLMFWDEQQAFIRDALGPKFKEAALATKIYVFDHNYNYDNMETQTDYPVKIYADKQAADYIAGAAYHNYGGDISELMDIHSKSDKELVFTETSIGTWNDGRNLAVRLMEDMSEVALGTVNNWCKGVIVWNLMLDENKGPNRDGGCQTCYGAVDINSSDYSTMTKNSHYFVIAHLSAVVKPGAVRIGADAGTALTGVTSSAFVNPDGSYALVLMNNNSDAKALTISDGRRYFSYSCPPKSVASFCWKK
ncbi:MAG: O-Glycosyl hydrolase family 30 [Bacteroidetes bacterium]|nr:O-Glycosyl hydrolase family 30 [Bacteroidota bacterium]